MDIDADSTAHQDYWSTAGRVGYAETMYANKTVAEHMVFRLAAEALQTAEVIGLNSQSRVFDIGCGDGSFANNFLAPRFQEIVGYDKAKNSVARANANKKSNAHFYAKDISNSSVDDGFDGAFLIGILHHVKSSALQFMCDLNKRVPKAVVLEPNGNHILRKALEVLPSYKAAGEESFTTTELKELFDQAGYDIVHYKRINIFPNFTPKWMFKALHRFEPIIENSRVLNRLCTSQYYGLVRKAL